MSPKILLPAAQQVFGSPPSKLSTVSYPAKPSPDNSPGTRIPASQPRKWLRIDEAGKSAYIKVSLAASLPWLQFCLLCVITCSVVALRHTAVTQVEKHQLVGSLNIPYRDLRILDPLVSTGTTLKAANAPVTSGTPFRPSHSHC